MTPISLLFFSFFSLLPFFSFSLSSSSSTLAVIYSPLPTICAILANSQRIVCFVTETNRTHYVQPKVPFSAIAGGGGGNFCGIRLGGHSLICWNSDFVAKRVYVNETVLLTELTFGDQQVCAITNGKTIKCWRDKDYYHYDMHKYSSISSGLGFNCGVLADMNKTQCWGTNSSMAASIESQYANESMHNIVVGGKFACGSSVAGFLTCKGQNGMVNLNSDMNSLSEYSDLALGENHVCAIEKYGYVVCSGGDREDSFSSRVIDGISFASIATGLDFTCGLIAANHSIICWGPGWRYYKNEVPLSKILPGPCVQSNCSCGTYANSQSLCSNKGNICNPCVNSVPVSSSPPTISSPPSKESTKRSLAFVIVGSVGVFSGICTLIYCLWAGVCCGNKKVHNSVQPTVVKSNSNGHRLSSDPPSRSLTIRRQGSRLMRRQRSGTSSKHQDKAEEFSFTDLVNATDNFSLGKKIGAGSFGIVYRGKLWDGREVAIKRGETGVRAKKFQEKESAFDSELAFLSRLHHKHLVRLVGYCEDNDERLLVYEFMQNGALHDHLHDKNNVDKHSSLLNSWKKRIKVTLDAARGIEYLHSYAVPAIIHRDIKSSNILLDETWTARVSDFGLSMMEPGPGSDVHPIKAVGTVGYIDPEYYSLHVLTGKSDIYGFGVVLLEILTGKRAVFKLGDGDQGPTALVDFAVPMIMSGHLAAILDHRVGPPEEAESEALELVAYMAVHCVNLEGKDRPNMTDIVANLEWALSLCGDSHGSISSGGISISSE